MITKQHIESLKKYLGEGNGQTFFIEEKDSLREYEYFIMTERGNTFEKL